MYTLVIDVGEKLRTVCDPETSSALQEELSQLQQRWGQTQALLEKKMMQFSGTLQVDDALPTCCSGIESQEVPCPTISRAHCRGTLREVPIMCHQGLRQAKTMVS